MTFIRSGESVSSTRIETLPTSSRSRRSRSWRDVTYCPSRPAKGEVLTPKTIDTVGSSMAIGAIGAGASVDGDGFANRDAVDAGKTDDVAGGRLVDVDALQSVECEQLGHAGRLDGSHRACETPTGSPIRTRPLKTRPMAMRPR